MNVPAYLSTFIGRKSELGELKTLIHERSIRLLTLTGPGGCGKTRLANEILSEINESFEDGAVWVSLAGLSHTGALYQETAAMLEIRLAPGQTLPEALVAALRQREILLVLDNCEHLNEACAQLVDILLRACPEVHVLATSRQKLGVEGEQVWPVPPLSYPADDSSPLNSPLEYDALQLFTARARLVRPKFEADMQTFPTLVRIVRLLEGMPLALELAAARLNELDLSQMVKKLEGQLSFLAGKGHTVVSRHRSIRETIDWSFGLLSEAEKSLFSRLGVFNGGFSLEAAEGVCGEPPLAEGEILDLLGILIDKSLVIRESRKEKSSHYRQLESIRQYAAEQLQEAGEENLMRDRHLAYFARLVREAEPHLLGARQKEWTERLEAEYENLQAALSWSIHKALEDESLSLVAAKMMISMYWYWNYTGRHEEAKDRYEMILELPGLDRDSPVFADLKHHLATFIWLLGNYPEAERLLRDCIQISQRVDHPYRLGHAKLMLGILCHHRGQTGQAVGLLRESEEQLATLQDVRGQVITYANLSGVFLASGDLETAQAYAKKAVQNARLTQDLWGLGLSVSGLGEVLYRQGEVEQAFALMEEALELIESSGQQWLQAEALWRIGEMFRDQGDLEQARKKLEQCYDLAQDSGAMEWQLSSLKSLGFLSLSMKDYPQAAGHFSEIMRMTGGQGYEHILVHSFLGVVRLALVSRQERQATALWDAYGGLKTIHGLPLFEEEQVTIELLKTSIERTRSGMDVSLLEAAGLAMEITRRFEQKAVAVPSTYNLQMFGLGPTEIYLDGRLLAASDWTFAKPKELLYFLASSSPKTKEQIGLTFWPDASPNELRVSLRAALYHLRRALGERGWILFEDGYYRFNRSMDYWYDVEAFEAGLEHAEKQIPDNKEAAIESLEAAVALYRDDFVAGLASDEWAALRREELRGNYLRAMSVLGDLLTGNGVYDRAIEVYRSLLSKDNLMEATHRALMRCYALKGERALALRQYNTLVDVLHHELGVPPSSETTALFRSLQ